MYYLRGFACIEIFQHIYLSAQGSDLHSVNCILLQSNFNISYHIESNVIKFG